MKALWLILVNTISSPRRLNQRGDIGLVIFNSSGSSLSRNTQTTAFPPATFVKIISLIPNQSRMRIGKTNTQLRRRSFGITPDGYSLKSHQKGEKFRVCQSGDGWWVWRIHSMTLFKKYLVWMYELRLALGILGVPTINKRDGISIWTMQCSHQLKQNKRLHLVIKMRQNLEKGQPNKTIG